MYEGHHRKLEQYFVADGPRTCCSLWQPAMFVEDCCLSNAGLFGPLVGPLRLQEAPMRKNSTRSFQLEAVENRRMMAGDVAVAFDGQLMDIRGDALANQFAINQNLAGTTITVVGQNGTLINGLPSVAFANALGISKLDIRGEDGDDRVTINRLRIAGDVNADLGVNLLGRDVMAVNNSTIDGSLFAYGGLENDTINLTNTTVALDATIDLAEGAGRSNITNASILGAATFVGGEGNDVFNSNGMTIGLELKLETKQGDDIVSYLASSASIFNASTDIGADRVTVDGFTTAEDFVVETGDGNDTVTLNAVASSKNLSVNLDSGNDRLNVSNSSAAEDAVLKGGAGTDTLLDTGLTGGVKKEVIEFEVLL
jgi:hypothetical protein